jgi:hypothetical protein
MRWRRLFAAVAVATGSLGLVGPGIGAARALPAPPLPVSLGTATLVPEDFGNYALTLNGAIAVGAGEFTGQATGTISGSPTSFTLQGPGLQGTCSGHWVVPPHYPGINTTIDLSAAPSVAEASLACTLQLGTAPAAQTGLSIAAVEVPALGPQFTGLFAPGPSSLPDPAPVSLGTADLTVVNEGRDSSCTFTYDLVGDIALGGQAFHGDASGSYVAGPCGVVPPSFTLSGTSPSGDLSATCLTPNDAQSIPGTESLSCTGHVGAGPTGSTTLLLLEPIIDLTNPLGSSDTYIVTHTSGVFVGI